MKVQNRGCKTGSAKLDDIIRGTQWVSKSEVRFGGCKIGSAKPGVQNRGCKIGGEKRGFNNGLRIRGGRF